MPQQRMLRKEKLVSDDHLTITDFTVRSTVLSRKTRREIRDQQERQIPREVAARRTFENCLQTGDLILKNSLTLKKPKKELEARPGAKSRNVTNGLQKSSSRKPERTIFLLSTTAIITSHSKYMPLNWTWKIGQELRKLTLTFRTLLFRFPLQEWFQSDSPFFRNDMWYHRMKRWKEDILELEQQQKVLADIKIDDIDAFKRSDTYRKYRELCLHSDDGHRPVRVASPDPDSFFTTSTWTDRMSTWKMHVKEAVDLSLAKQKLRQLNRSTGEVHHHDYKQEKLFLDEPCTSSRYGHRY